MLSFFDKYDGHSCVEEYSVVKQKSLLATHNEQQILPNFECCAELCPII